MTQQQPNEAEAKPRNKRRHLEMLVFCLIALIAAPLLEVRNGEQVGLRGFDNLNLPGSCASREYLDTDCPGCGMTRSFVYIAHGDLKSSFAKNRLGWLLMGMAALQVPYRIHAIWGSGKYLLSKKAGWWLSGTVIALLIGNWILLTMGI